MILLDTNILLRYAQTHDPFYELIRQTMDLLQDRGDVLCVVPQTFYEFWAVASRPVTSNGFGLSIGDCHSRVTQLKRIFRFLPDRPTLYDEWESLVSAHACQGRVSYDARLVAAMRTHGIRRILTLNGPDFARFPGVRVVSPADPTSLTGLPNGGP